MSIEEISDLQGMKAGLRATCIADFEDKHGVKVGVLGPDNNVKRMEEDSYVFAGDNVKFPLVTMGGVKYYTPDTRKIHKAHSNFIIHPITLKTLRRLNFHADIGKMWLSSFTYEPYIKFLKLVYPGAPVWCTGSTDKKRILKDLNKQNFSLYAIRPYNTSGDHWFTQIDISDNVWTPAIEFNTMSAREPQIPQQLNGYDCGVLTIMVMTILAAHHEEFDSLQPSELRDAMYAHANKLNIHGAPYVRYLIAYMFRHPDEYMHIIHTIYRVSTK